MEGTQTPLHVAEKMNPANLSFFVEGTPAPGGSKSVFPMWRKDGSLVTKPISGGRVMPILRVTDAGGKGNEKWKEIVAWRGKEFMNGAPPFLCPLKVEFVFFLKRPQTHFRTGKYAHLLRDDAPEFHKQIPDALKLARSTEDALTGIVWHDDSQTVRVCSEKRWCNGDDKPGCTIRMVPLNPPTIVTSLSSLFT